jgi:hypothetical protein
VLTSFGTAAEHYFYRPAALPQFNRNLRGTRLLCRLGAEAAARRYVARVNRRHSITPRVARRYSTLHLARGFPLLQRLPLSGLQRWAAGAQAAAFPRLFGRLFAEEQAVPQEERRADAGFVLLVARTRATPA